MPQKKDPPRFLRAGQNEACLWGKRQSERRDSSDGFIVPPHRTTFSSHSVTSCIGMYPTSNDGFAHADSLLPGIQSGSMSERLREAPTKRRTEAAMPHECTRNTACILPPRLTLRSPIKCPALPRQWVPTNRTMLFGGPPHKAKELNAARNEANRGQCKVPPCSGQNLSKQRVL